MAVPFEQQWSAYIARGVDLKTVADIDLGTISAINAFFPLIVVVAMEFVNATPLTPATLSVGKTASAYADIMAATALPATLDTTGEYSAYHLAGNPSLYLVNGDVLKCRVSVAATMSGGASAWLATVAVLGVQVAIGGV